MQNVKPLLRSIPNHYQIFNPIKKRVPSSVNPKNKTGFNYSSHIDNKASRLKLKALFNNFPNNNSSIIISGSLDSKTFTIFKIINSSIQFKNQNKNQSTFSETFNEFLVKMAEKNYKYIKFQIALNN